MYLLSTFALIINKVKHCLNKNYGIFCKIKSKTKTKEKQKQKQKENKRKQTNKQKKNKTKKPQKTDNIKSLEVETILTRTRNRFPP